MRKRRYLIYSTRRVSVITWIKYSPSQKHLKPNNFKEKCLGHENQTGYPKYGNVAILDYPLGFSNVY